MHSDPLLVVVARVDVERGDPESTLRVLRPLLQSSGTLRTWRERVDIAFHGYDHDRRELFEIPEVRAFVARLDAEFPYWLFFLRKEGTGLQALAFSFLPPYLTESAQNEIWPKRLAQLLEERWLPALVHAASNAGYSESQIDAMIAASAHYFVEGPQLPFDMDAI